MKSQAAEMIHYGMTKTAQLSISRGMAELTKRTGVTVNSIMPGPTKSRAAGRFIEDMAKAGNITAEEAENNFFGDIRLLRLSSDLLPLKKWQTP